MKSKLVLIALLALAVQVKSQVVYNYTGSLQSYVVPAGVTSIDIYMWGGGGAGGDRSGGGLAGAGGSGAFVKGTLAVTPGQTYQIVVGGRGTYSTTNGTHAGGYGGGGTAYQNAGSGGGYSGIFLNTVTFANARAIAGGGGGAGEGRERNFGGGGGATNGTAGGGLDATHTGGGGGTLASGGAGGTGAGTTSGTAGAQLLGGTGGNAGANTYGGAGGGGGYYGGGGGYGSNQQGNGGTWGSGGGGGSSYTTGLTSVTNTQGNFNNAGGANNPPGITETYYNGTAGVGGAGDGSSGGHGLVVIISTPACSGTPTITSASISATTGAPNAAITLSAVATNQSGLTYQWQSGPTAAGPWTNIAGATSNPSTVYAPSTVSTVTYYRLVLTCANSGLFANSTTTLSFTTNGPCNPSMAGSATYIDSVKTIGYSTNIYHVALGWTSPGYNNYYAAANSQVTVAAGSVLRIYARIVRGTGGPNDVYETFYIDWNDDGVFDINTEFIDAYAVGSTGYYAFDLNLPADAALGDHRLRIIADKRASAVADPCVSGTGEALDFKVTIIANNCSSSPTAAPNNSLYFISQVSFIGTLVTPPANNTGAGLVAGYSDYTGLATTAQQEQGEGVNVYVAVGTGRAKFAAWVDWNKDNIFSSPSEIVYFISEVHTNNTTFGFQIPIGTAPGDYKIRIRSYNYFDDLLAPDSILKPCGAMYNGETEDYLFKVLPRCNARVASVTGQSQCANSATAFTLGVTGVDANTTGFSWYAASSGGSPLPGATFNGGSPPTGAFATPAISSTTTYYVAAIGLNSLGAACVSNTRVAVTATYNPNITLTFNPPGPIFVCQGSGLSVQGSTGTETKVLINEDFESGGLGVFSVINTTATPAASVADMQWRNRTSVFVPTYASVWQPAISSGFGTNRFALAVSDIPGAVLNTSLQLTNAVSTIGFTNLTLEYDIFYDSYLGDGTNGSTSGYDTIRVEVSTNNTTYVVVQSFIIDQGIGTQFVHQTLSLPAYINQSNLKLRFRYRANWVDGVAVDNIKLYGTAPTSSNYTWIPTGVGGDPASMFLDAAYTQPYIAGTNVSGIFVNPTAAQIIAGNNLTFQASLTLSNGCIATGTISINLNDKVWEGDESGDWHTPGNWCGNLVPLSSTSVVIPAGVPNMPVISTAAGIVRRIEIDPGASLNINNPGTGSLSVSTDFVNNGTLTNNGTIILNGTSATAQTFPGPGTITAMATLEINNSGAGVSLNNNVRIGSTLKPTLGNLSLNNSDITISSVAGRTALVSQVGASAGFTYNGTGRFVVERFIPARRAWRLMTAPIASAGSLTINQAWQEGAGGTWASNPSPGFGTHITGGPTRTTAQGYDQGPLNPSIYGHTGTAWSYLPLSTSEAVTSRQGWMLFIRGSRSINLPLSNPSTIADNTTLRPRGQLKTGTQPLITNTTGGYMVVGNPYASPINFKNITRTGVIGGVGGNAYYLWDPSLGGSSGVGAFVALAWNGSTYVRSIETGTGTSNISTDGTIPSGAAFIVNQSANGTIGFEENDKDTVIYGNSFLFRPSPTGQAGSSLRLSLYGAEADGSTSIADGTLISFNPASRIEVDNEDVLKTNNVRENISILKEDKKIAIEFRKALRNTDTIFYQMWNMSRKHYVLEVKMNNVRLQPGMLAFLEDSYLQQKTALENNGNTHISFEVTADAGSAAPDRFRIVMKMADYTSNGPGDIPDNTVLGISAFPNPLPKGSSLSLLFKNMPDGIYTAVMRNINGQRVFERTIKHSVNNKSVTMQLDDNFIGGVYHIEILKKGSGYSQTFKLIVE